MRCAALNTGPEFHLLDHIAPLADLMRMPLIITEELNYELARRYYPQVEIRHMPDWEFQLSAIAEQFDALFDCRCWTKQMQSLFRQLYNKEMRLICCPHGQSDKGFIAPILAPYAWQDMVLVYGELLINMLKDLDVWPSIAHHIIVGNYRLAFYQKYRSFYDGLIDQEIRLNKKNLTLLYAPTWDDAEGSSSFFKHAELVISQLPHDWNLIIKVHPLLEQRDPARFYSIAALAEKKPNAFLIHAFPPVYPILAQADIYLGDASSIGYDFLYFQRPLYFFPTDHPGKLYSCGQIIDPQKNIYAQLERDNSFKDQQKKLYQLAFESQQTEEQLQAQISRALFRE